MGDGDDKRVQFCKDDLLKKLKELNIDHDTIDHPEVFTVETMMEHLKDLPPKSAVAKNLFLKDKKKNLYLLSAVHDKTVNLSDLGKLISAPGGLRFADESILEANLGVKQGCVTAFALINDVKNAVKFVVDEDLVSEKYDKVYFHPLTNSASTGISSPDFIKFIEASGHTYTTVHLSNGE